MENARCLEREYDSKPVRTAARGRRKYRHGPGLTRIWACPAEGEERKLTSIRFPPSQVSSYMLFHLFLKTHRERMFSLCRRMRQRGAGRAASGTLVRFRTPRGWCLHTLQQRSALRAELMCPVCSTALPTSTGILLSPWRELAVWTLHSLSTIVYPCLTIIAKAAFEPWEVRGRASHYVVSPVQP